MRFLIKLLSFIFAACIVALVLWYCSDGFENWQVANWFNNWTFK